MLARRSFLGSFAALFAVPVVAKTVEITTPVEKTAKEVIEKLNSQGMEVLASPPSSLYQQIMPSLQRVKTKPCEYSRQLVKMLSDNKDMTTHELAAKLGKSHTWLRDRLSLVNLRKDIQDLVDDGEICLQNAYYLARMRKENQGYFLKEAKECSPNIMWRLAFAYRKYTKNRDLIKYKTVHEGPNIVSFRHTDEDGVERTFGVSLNPRKAGEKTPISDWTLNSAPFLTEHQVKLIEQMESRRGVLTTIDFVFDYKKPKNANFAELYGKL